MFRRRPHFGHGCSRIAADEQRLALFVVVDAQTVVDVTGGFDFAEELGQMVTIEADDDHGGGCVAGRAPPPVGVVAAVWSR